MSTCSTYVTEQIAIIDAQLAAINAAILALLSGDHAEYTLDSGQTLQRVTRLDLKKLQDMKKYLQQDRYRMLAQCAGPSTIATPFA